MWASRVRNGLNPLDVQNSKVRLPAVIPKERVVIGAWVSRCALAKDDSIAHLTHRDIVVAVGVDPEANDPPSELVHDDEHSDWRARFS